MRKNKAVKRILTLGSILIICFTLTACDMKEDGKTVGGKMPKNDEMQQQEDMIALVFRSYDTTEDTVTVKVKNVSEKTILMDEVIFSGEDGEGNVLAFEGETMNVVLEPGETTKKFRYRAVVPEGADLAVITTLGYRCETEGQIIEDIFDEKDAYNVEEGMSDVTPWQK